MKKINYFIIVCLLILAGSVYYLNSKKNNSLEINYQDPETAFLNQNQIPDGAIIIEIGENEFSPASLEIRKGDTVFWINRSKGYAWPASDPHPTHTNYGEESGLFDPEIPMKENQAWAFTFQKPGNWKYHDHLDPIKRGIIVVSE